MEMPPDRITLDVRDIVVVLNELIQTNKDSEKLFAYATGDVLNIGYKATFARYSRQRAGFARALQSAVLRLGGDPIGNGTVMGAVLQGWMDIKSAVAVREDLAILQEVERGEDVAKKHYESALQKSLSDDVRALLERQLESVRECHDRIRLLSGSTN